MRIPPAFVPLLNLQPGQVVHGEVVVHNGQRTLEVKQQNLPLPSRATLPTSATLLNEPLIFRVKVVDGQQVLTLVQASPAVKAADTGILRPLLQTAQTIQISQQQARSLGLVVGQPIQAKVAQTGSGTILSVLEKSITFPQRIGMPGKTVELTLGLNRGQHTLTTTIHNPTIPAQNLNSQTKQLLATGKNVSALENLAQLENKPIARFNRVQMNQLGLRAGQVLTAAVSYSATGSELKLPKGSLPLPPTVKNIKVTVALVRQSSDCLLYTSPSPRD